MGGSKPLDVFEESPLEIPVSLTGVYKAAPGCDVVIYEGKFPRQEVERIKVDTEWGKGSATWTPAKLEGDAVYETFNYRVEVMGLNFKCGCPIMRVWARELELEVVGVDDKPMAKAEAAFKPGGGAEQVLKADDAGKITYELSDPQPVDVDMHAPFYADKWLDKEGRTRKVKAKLGFKAEIRQPKTKEDSHKQWVNMEPEGDHPDFGTTLKLVVGSQGDDPAFVGQKVYVKTVAQRDNSKRTLEPGQDAPGKETLHELTLNDACEAELELELGHAGGNLVSVSVGGCEKAKDGHLWVETWRRISYELISPDFVKLPQVETLEGGKSAGLPQGTYEALEFPLQDVYVAFALKNSRRLKKASIPKHELFSSAYLGLKGRTRWLRSFRAFEEGDPPGLDTPSKTDLNVLLVDGLLRYEQGTRQLKVFLEDDQIVGGRKGKVLRARINLADFTGLVLSPAHVKTGDPTLIVEGAYWTAKPPEDQEDHPGWNPEYGPPFAHTGDLSAEMLVATDLQGVEIRFPKGSIPAKLLGKSSKTRCPIEVGFQVQLAHHMAGAHHEGNIASALVDAGIQSAGIILAHELGHAMGMTITSKGNFTSPVPPGLEPPKTVDEGGTYYVNPPAGEGSGANGFRDGHVGPHCAYGIGNKAAPGYGKEIGSCIMFGEAALRDPPLSDMYCETCVDYLRARKLTDLVSKWSGRAEG